MYAAAGAALVDHCLSGFNTSIFAWGQTGSGKTHTMLGDVSREVDGSLSRECGLIPRVFEELFASIADREQSHRSAACSGSLRYSVKCSFLEIYNEEVTDLLSPGSKGLQIRDGDLKKGVYVQGLSETEVLNPDDVLSLIARGSQNRSMAATRMNERSSRSHSVFTATIESHERTPAGVEHVTFSRVNLIDLAGSERVGRSGAAGQQLTEAKSINKSLAVLSRVISALVEHQRRSGVHIPYRDSRLTFLLQESLGGNSKTCIIANVTPSADSVSETYSTLAFAAGAKKIKCRAVVNEDRRGDAAALAAENQRLDKVVGDMGQQLEQAQALFDQNNAAITEMRAEQGVLRRELSEAKAVVNRLGEESMQLRADNALLSAAIAAEEAERERLWAELTVARETAAWEAESCKKSREEAATLQEELTDVRASAESLAAEVAEAREGCAAATALLGKANAEVLRLQTDAEEEKTAAAAREESLRREVAVRETRCVDLETEVGALRKQLNGEHTSVVRYKRMVGEIGRLVDWAQTATSSVAAGPSAAAAGGGGGVFYSSMTPGGPRNGEPTAEAEVQKPSPAAQAALRVARMSLSGKVGGGGGIDNRSLSPLGNVTNASGRPSSARGSGARV